VARNNHRTDIRDGSGILGEEGKEMKVWMGYRKGRKGQRVVIRMKSFFQRDQS
jgi:hypothetical protein